MLARAPPSAAAVTAILVVAVLLLSAVGAGQVRSVPSPAGGTRADAIRSSPSADSVRSEATGGSTQSTSPASGPTLNWTELSPKTAPPPRTSGGMVYDSSDGYLMLFGGEYEINYHDADYNDTWTFENGTWKNISGAVAPSERFGFMLADDPADHAVVLFGGHSPTGTFAGLNNTWEFHAGVWTNVTYGTSPPARFWGSMTYDAALSEVVLFGGDQGGSLSTEYLNDTWAFHDGTWTNLTNSMHPSGRDGDALVDDVADDAVVEFGGLNESSYLNDTWEFSGTTWSQVSGPQPDERTGAGLAYDTAAQAVVMFGGYPADFYYSYTWLFHAGVWTSYDVTPSPPSGTIWGQMAYDPAMSEVILFQDNLAGNETWALNVTEATSPLSIQASASPLNGTAPLNVTFTASASGGTPPYAYTWSFGDGNGSAVQDTNHTYPTSGHYRAVLTVTDDVGTHATMNWTIQVNSTTGPPLSVIATVSPLSGTVPLLVTFTAQAAGGTRPYEYAWGFGDAGTSSSENTSHSYDTPGIYDVNLTVTDGASGSVVDHWTVTANAVVGTPLSLVANAAPLAGTTPLLVSFTASASGGAAPYAFLWSFGDQATSTSENPTHTYDEVGAYPVTVTVTDHADATQSDSWTVKAVAPTLTVTISATPTAASVGQSVAFVSTPSGGVPPYTYLWGLGDEASATTRNASHGYSTAGTFHVTLEAKDSAGTTANASATVVVSAASPMPASSPTVGWVDWLLVAVIVLVVIVAFVIYRQRRRKPSDTRPVPTTGDGPSPRG